MTVAKHLRLSSFLVPVFLALALPAHAQVEAPTPAARNERETVIVTANKREETVQDVAVAITAVTSEDKQDFGIITVTDLTNVTPGLSYTPGNERVTLRGIGRLTNSFGADPGVANYNDGLYTPFAVFAGKDPLLIERVEILRGPQGTLYGRNAIGGAINTISKRPTDTTKVEAIFGAGNFNDRKIGVAVSGPITDWLRYRAVGFKETRDGIDFNYGENENVGWEINDNYLEGQLEGDIGQRFTWWLKVADLNYVKQGPPGGRTATFSTAPYLTNVPAEQFLLSGSLTPNGAFGFTNNPSIISVTQAGTRRDNPFATSGEHAYNTTLEPTAILNSYDEAIAQATYSADGFDIKYTGGYTYYAYELPEDTDGTPIESVTYRAIAPLAGQLAPDCEQVVGFPVSFVPACGFVSNTKTLHPNVTNTYRESRALFSNEINLISTSNSPFQWIFGLYQYQENSKQPGQIQYLQDEPLASSYLDLTQGVVANPDRLLQYFSNTSFFNAYGVYGQADYSFNDQWKATVGLRWSKDIKESKEEAFLACYIICGFDYFNYTPIAYGGVPGASFDERGFATRRLEGSWEAVTGTAGVEYRPTEDALLFLKYSRGYKSGGFNNLGFAAAPYTNSEFVDAYEAGWKQEWAGLNLTTDAAVFFYNYKDAQAPLTVIDVAPNGAQISTEQFVNLPQAESSGFELETNWNPIEPLNVSLTYAYLNAEITESDIYADASRDPGDPSTGRLPDPLYARSVKGNKLSQSPEHKVAVSLSYRFDMQDGSSFLPTVTYSWRDEFYDSFFNNELEKSPAYENVDARLNWRSSKGRFGVTAWVRNAFDEDQTTSVSNFFRTGDLSRYQSYSFSLPRTFGLDLLVNF